MLTELREKKPTDWQRKFDGVKPAHVVTLMSDFAGIKTGSTMLIGTPEMIADYVAAIPAGETRSIARMRNELARRNEAQTMCPVTTAIFLRIVAEVAITGLRAGKGVAEVTPVWRVIEPGSTIAKKLSDFDLIRHHGEMERAAVG
jgi:hypothetical protein